MQSTRSNDSIEIKLMIDSYISAMNSNEKDIVLIIKIFDYFKELISRLENDELFDYAKEQIQKIANSLEITKYMLNGVLNERAAQFFAERGGNFIATSDLAQASFWYRRWSVFDPANADAYYHCGLVSKIQGDLESALSYFMQSVSINNKKIKPINTKIKINPSLDQQYQHTLSMLKRAEDELSQFRSIVKSSLEKNSNIARKLYEFYLTEANQAAETGHVTNAIANYLYVLELNLDDSFVDMKMKHVLFNIYSEEERVAVREQIQILSTAKKTELEQILESQHYYLNAKIQFNEKQYSQSLQNFSKVLAVYPSHPFAYDRICNSIKELFAANYYNADIAKIFDSAKSTIKQVPQAQSNKLDRLIDKEYFRSRSYFYHRHKRNLQAIFGYAAFLNLVIEDQELNYNDDAYNHLIDCVTNLTSETDRLHAMVATQDLEIKLPDNHRLKLQEIFNLQKNIIIGMEYFAQEKYADAIASFTPAIQQKRDDFSHYAYYCGLAFCRLNNDYKASLNFILALSKTSPNESLDACKKLVEAVMRLKERGSDEEINDVKIKVINLKNSHYDFGNIANKLERILNSNFHKIESNSGERKWCSFDYSSNDSQDVMEQDEILSQDQILNEGIRKMSC